MIHCGNQCIHPLLNYVKITGMDTLAKQLTILMSLVTVPWELTNRFSWIMRNCSILEKPYSVMAGSGDEQ